VQTTDVLLQTLRTQPDGLGALPLITSLQRIGGGYETDVYRTEDERYVVKLKRTGYRSVRMAHAQAHLLQAIADHFVSCLGVEHSLPSTFAVARDNAGNAQVVTIQPFLKDARPLYTVDYPALPQPQRHHLMAQLHTIIARSQECYRTTGLVPDLYGVSGVTPGELARLRAPYMTPLHMWNFFMTRTLLSSHNLLLTPEQRVILVDYDLVMLHKPHLFRRIYFAFRAILFWRDLAVIRFHNCA
jgi:hypothetical protein